MQHWILVNSRKTEGNGLKKKKKQLAISLTVVVWLRMYSM